MRLITCEYQQRYYLGIAQDDIALLPALGGEPLNDMVELIAGGPGAWQRYRDLIPLLPSSCRVPLAHVRLLAPIPRPGKNILCLGLNYADHVAESSSAHGREIATPDHLVVFTKAVTSVTGPTADIPYDNAVTRQLDWEVELAVVIGRPGRHIREERAMDHVFGYTVVNDLSARDLQFRHKQYFLGKSLDHCCPMGPWIVTCEDIPDPQGLDLRCWVNGQLKQEGNTRQQIFSIAAIIATLSRSMTLEAGDVIATGTPAGVGFARTPPEFLKPGDLVECEVAGIGRLSNRIVMEDQGSGDQILNGPSPETSR
jgi:2-keto-4-pentenoate hydratase/2-oxohepta-3-ene-1,7-dioic acid hydratase in catechol pathway